jgi:hypothetical protein
MVIWRMGGRPYLLGLMHLFLKLPHHPDCQSFDSAWLLDRPKVSAHQPEWFLS